MTRPQAPDEWSNWLPAAVREVEDFLAEAGWEQPPQLFALVPTAELVRREPGLAERLPSVEGLTPIAQEPLGDQADLAETLAGICWPEEVAGCALAQEIMVLPPAAEAELDSAVAASGEADAVGVARRVAGAHPDRRDARLVVGVLRGGEHRCLLRLRGAPDGATPLEELVEHPDLAPNLVAALLTTLID